MTIAEKQFNSPQDLNHVEPQIKPPVLPEASLSIRGQGIFPGALLGNWITAEPATRGLVKIELEMLNGRFMVHPYGACVPTPCDWGRQLGIAYAANVGSELPVAFSAVFSFTFKDTILSGHLEGVLLMVQSFNHFKDKSPRSDYCAREIFRRG